MNFNREQTRYAGIALIVFGVFAIFRLWWLVPALLLAGAGVYLYMQRRRMGRINEAVQFGMWGVGLALLALLHFIFPGVLLLAGASLLLRGNETKADDRVQLLLARFRNRRNAAATSTSIQSSRVTIVNEEERATTGETVRLK